MQLVLRRRFSEIPIRFPSHVEIDTIWGTPNGKLVNVYKKLLNMAI